MAIKTVCEGEDKFLCEVTSALRDHLKEDSVALVTFGSYARGEALDSSDCDLYVIAENSPKHPTDRSWFVRAPLALDPNLNFTTEIFPSRSSILSDAVFLHSSSAISSLTMETGFLGSRKLMDPATAVVRLKWLPPETKKEPDTNRDVNQGTL